MIDRPDPSVGPLDQQTGAEPAPPSPAEAYQRFRSGQATPELSAFADGYGFVFDDYQREACAHLEGGSGVLVAAPTGAGKTIVGEFAVWLALQRGRKAFYTTPIKALSNQKYADLVRRHGSANVGLLTGDSSINSEAPVVVMTTEVLRNMIYAGSSTLDNLGFVVMDEVHYLADRFRGAVWEEVIIGLAESIQLIALSATVSNAEEFGDWLSEVRGQMAVVVSERRPVPLFQHVLVGKRLYDLFADEAAHGRRPAQPGDRRGQPGAGQGQQGGGATRPRRLAATPGTQRQGQAGDRVRQRAVRWRGPPLPDRWPWRTTPLAGGGVAARSGAGAGRRGAAAGDRVHLLPAGLRCRGRPAARLRHPADHRRGAGRAGRDRRSARGRTVRRRSAGARLRPIRRGAAAGDRGPPRRHAACLQGGRRGGVRQRPGQGGVRDRDVGPRHQHARAQRGAGEAGQVQRRDPRRHHPRRVHAS